MSYRVIEAAEIVEYVYCRRSWWLQRMAGYESDHISQMVEGNVYHQNHRARVEKARRAQRIALAFIFLAVSIITFWLFMSS